MTGPARLEVSLAVEGLIDEVVVSRLVEESDARPAVCYGKNGKDGVLQSLAGFNNAARRWPWVVVVDLDDDPECAPDAVRQWLSEPAPLMCLRIAVRAMESWLLADDERFSEWFRVARSRVPRDPDSLPDPKRALVDLCRRSRSGAIREDVVPREGSGPVVGPGYTQRMIGFAGSADGWRPAIAARRSDSLARCRAAVGALVRRAPLGG